jgi:peptide/nickel transport system substrate-binding protein
VNPEDRQDILLMRWWPDYASPSSWFDALVLSEESISFNLAYIRDAELDEMILTADAAVANDRDTAEALYIEAQKKLLDESPMIFMYDDSHTFITNKSISGLYENPAYSYVVHYYDITKNG